MLKLLRIPGIICLVYYLVIVIYSGFQTDFSKIWLAAGVVLLLLPGLWKLKIKHYPNLTLPGFVKIGGGAFVAAGILIFCFFLFQILGSVSERGKENLDYVIILGAQVRGDRPSRSLVKRLDEAVGYARNNPAAVFILSGGQGSGEDISEAEAMYVYLTARGVESDRLILEDQSVNTYENFKYSIEKLPDTGAEVGVISNNFHIYRAVNLGKKQGLSNICGIAAPSDGILLPHFIVREVFAAVKDKFTGNF